MLCSFNFSQTVPKLRYFPNCKGPGPIPNELEKNPGVISIETPKVQATTNLAIRSLRVLHFNREFLN